MGRIISHNTKVRKINDISKGRIYHHRLQNIREHNASAFLICKVALLPETRLRKKEKSTKNAFQAVSHTLLANFCPVCAACFRAWIRTLKLKSTLFKKRRTKFILKHVRVVVVVLIKVNQFHFWNIIPFKKKKILIKSITRDILRFGLLYDFIGIIEGFIHFI